MENTSFQFSDWGLSNEQAIADLQKAVTAEQVSGLQTTGVGYTGASLKLESLDKTIKKLTIKMESIKLYRDMPKMQIFNTVHQFVQETSFSTVRSTGLIEGEVPYENNSEYVQRAITTSYVGEMRRISDVAMEVNTIAGRGQQLYQRAIDDGVMALTRQLNKLTARGNKAVIPTEFDGFNALHNDLAYWGTLQNYFNQTCVIDLRNDYLKNPDLNDGAKAIIEDGNGTGIALRLYTTFGVISKYTEQLTNTFFVNVGQINSQTANTGQRVNGFESTGGTIRFDYDITLKKNDARRVGQPAQNAKSPLAPTTPTRAFVNDAETRFATFNGGYYYAVAAVNRFGESALLGLTVTDTLLAVAGTEAVNLGWADGGGVGDQATTGYVIYRSEVNPSTTTANTNLYPLFEVSIAQKVTGYDGGSAGLVRDRNRFIANTEEAWLFQWDTDTIEFAELFGMKKVELPVGHGGFMGRSMAIINYGMPLLYAPRRVVRYINIKTT